MEVSIGPINRVRKQCINAEKAALRQSILAEAECRFNEAVKSLNQEAKDLELCEIEFASCLQSELDKLTLPTKVRLVTQTGAIKSEFYTEECDLIEVMNGSIKVNGDKGRRDVAFHFIQSIKTV